MTRQKKQLEKDHFRSILTLAALDQFASFFGGWTVATHVQKPRSNDNSETPDVLINAAAAAS